MEPSEAKRKRFSRLSVEEIQNLIEGKNSENTGKATKNAVVTFLAYWNEVKSENERVKNTESLEKIPKKGLNEPALDPGSRTLRPRCLPNSPQNRRKAQRRKTSDKIMLRSTIL